MGDFQGWDPTPRESGILITGEFKGNAYYLTAAYMPLPDAFLKKSTIKIGAGMGLSVIDLKFIVGETTDLSKNTLSFVTSMEYDFI